MHSTLVQQKIILALHKKLLSQANKKNILPLLIRITKAYNKTTPWATKHSFISLAITSALTLVTKKEIYASVSIIVEYIISGLSQVNSTIIYNSCIHFSTAGIQNWHYPHLHSFPNWPETETV
eukprot:TRINITY_DN7261_c0_g2_i3.p1 TRINITY_DN7261_c0_g2~~TRINITY_DN7261_c0_g2_i3.p1  ORF type:complete len:123 (+),score=2.56 TRINITY_DN7261_c0_g2_i3:54-422(+)